MSNPTEALRMTPDEDPASAFETYVEKINKSFWMDDIAFAHLNEECL